MNAADVAGVLSGIIIAALGGGGIKLLLTLRPARAHAQAEARKVTAEADHVSINSQVALGSAYETLIAQLRTEIDRIGKELDKVKAELTATRAAEWVCKENLESFRRACIASGVPIPPLREIRPVDSSADHPRRRLTDHIPDPIEGEPQ